jgi:peptidoglycan hydrolase-like protein with peptidoglycan-binding domain
MEDEGASTPLVTETTEAMIEAPRQRELPLEGHRRGDERPVIGRLQLRLGLPVTGVFDAATEQAVRNFQASSGQEVTGVADRRVFSRLNMAWEA